MPESQGVNHFLQQAQARLDEANRMDLEFIEVEGHCPGYSSRVQHELRAGIGQRVLNFSHTNQAVYSLQVDALARVKGGQDVKKS